MLVGPRLPQYSGDFIYDDPRQSEFTMPSVSFISIWRVLSFPIVAATLLLSGLAQAVAADYATILMYHRLVRISIPAPMFAWNSLMSIWKSCRMSATRLCRWTILSIT